MRRLVVNPGTPQAWEITLKQGVNSIGRNTSNDFTIDDPSVSGSHCRIQVFDDSVLLEDLGSTNGTFLNGAPIHDAALENGQRIQLGSVELAFYTEETQPSTPAPTRPAIRVSLNSPAPAAAVSNEDSPPTETRFCKFHPRSPGRFLCPKCNRLFCELCVNSRVAGGVGVKTCRSCGVECAPVQVKFVSPEKRSFFFQIRRAFLYPVRGDGWILLGVGTGLYVLIEVAAFFAKFAWIAGLISVGFLTLFGTGYFVTYMQRILTSSAMGEEVMPDWPEFTGFGDVFGAFFQFLALVLISFSPAFLLGVFAIGEEQTWAGIAMVPALCFGCVYFPMAFLACAMLGSVISANPLVVLPSIARVPKEYLLSAVIFGGMLVIRWGSDQLLSTLSVGKMTTHVFPGIFVLFGARGISNFLGLYLFTVNMRILGLLYFLKKDRLGWFNR
ncbi:MAG TPA: FHA domain-containing protein [Verrucomicrobiae bacterium]|nr:FHA domain-containing protein [Verrucomicrobiae bacterium]